MELNAWARKQDLYKHYKEFNARPHKNKKQKFKLIKKFHFSNLLKRLLKITDDFTYWQDERKKAHYFGAHIACKILEEMGKRRGVELKLLKYLLPNEVNDWFVKQTISEKNLIIRRNGCFVIWSKSGGQVYTTKLAQTLNNVIIHSLSAKSKTDIRGLVAHTGKVRGIVRRLMSISDLAKIKVGDILVAVMTRPDYLPAMKKAAAIVTNEGGITCHAAIVSRELGIPCIIGTKIATQMLKDGDLVEVNANHGVVTKL